MECKVGEVTQRFLNCRFLIKSYIENGALFIHTEVKQQDDIFGVVVKPGGIRG